jgi:hypothetical protein
MLIDLGFETHFINDVGHEENIKFFFLPLFLTRNEPVERHRDSKEKVFNLTALSTDKIM